jgi:plastocyanin domain-containing protein
MELDKVIVFIASLAGIGFTYWFFLMKKDKEVAVTTDSVDIVVKGGYNPGVISIPYGKTTKLHFLRKDSNSCLEEVVLGDFKIRKYLPVNEKVTIELKPEKKGEFGYSCGMGMFHGKIIVK